MKHSKRFIDLCRCRKPYEVRKCTGSAVKIVRHYFVLKGTLCQRVIKVKQILVRCGGRRPVVRRGACSRSTCLRTFTVLCKSVKACKCHSVVRRVRQRCCTPRPRVKRTCDVRRGYRVTGHKHFLLRNGGVLLRKAGVLIRKKVVDSETTVVRESVVCPAASRRVHCNRYSGIQTTTWLLWRRSACRCVRKKRQIRGKCSECSPCAGFQSPYYILRALELSILITLKTFGWKVQYYIKRLMYSVIFPSFQDVDHPRDEGVLAVKATAQ